MSDQSLSEYLTTPCAKHAGSISPVLINTQRDITFYTFVLDAEQFMELARVERFGVHEGGVNRQLKERRAFAIAEAMLEPNTVFAENPIGSLEGDWKCSDGKLHYGAGAYIVLDDGQHRRAALELLNPEERKRWQFTVTVTQGVPYQVRLKLFLQQALGQTIDSRLKLAMQAELGEWDTPAQARAYALCKELQFDTRSPLKGMIILEETERRPYEKRHRLVGINVKGLHLTFTSLMSRNSPLVQLSEEKQLEAIKNLIRAASHVWEHAWKSERHILTTAKGINALCKLFISGPSFRMAVGNDFSYENFVRVLTFASKFDWGAKKSVNVSERQLTERLDKSVAGGITKLQYSPDDVNV